MLGMRHTFDDYPSGKFHTADLPTYDHKRFPLLNYLIIRHPRPTAVKRRSRAKYP